MDQNFRMSREEKLAQRVRENLLKRKLQNRLKKEISMKKEEKKPCKENKNF